MATNAKANEIFDAIFGAPEDGHHPVLTTGPYDVEETPAGRHVISRKRGNPDLFFDRRPLTTDDIATLRACYLDGQGNNPNPEVIAYFDERLRDLKIGG